ncbi:MAG: cobalt ECF transporter T component CbiQ [Candidatus Desantisbacteria bacterium]
MLNEIFSDYFAHKDNFLTRIDARLKIFFVSLAIIITILSQRPELPIIICLLSIISLLSVRIPPLVVLVRLTAPLGLVAGILLIKGFFCKDSLLALLLIGGKIMGATSLVIFLSMTTPANKLLNSASWFKIPRTWIEIAIITYRYVFVLMEDAITIRNAQKVRLGYSNLSRSVRSLAQLVGSVFIRAYDQSISTYEAMQCRGKRER